MKERKFNQYDYNNQFRKERYDTLGLCVPKGMRAIIKKRAETLGMSVNAYFMELAKRDFEESGTPMEIEVEEKHD